MTQPNDPIASTDPTVNAPAGATAAPGGPSGFNTTLGGMNTPAIDYAGPAATEEDRGTASLAHFLSILGFIPPLIFYIIKKDRPFVLDQSREALNFEITTNVVIFAFCILQVIFAFIWAPLVWIASLAVIAVWVINLIFCVQGGSAAKKGIAYRYPFAVRVVK